MNRPRRQRISRPRERGLGARLLLVALVLVAVLIILLRLAEFSGHRVRRARPRMAPTAMVGILHVKSAYSAAYLSI